MDFETHLQPKSRFQNLSKRAMSKGSDGFALSRDRRMNRKEERSMEKKQEDLVDIPNSANGFSYRKRGLTLVNMCLTCRALLRNMSLEDKVNM